MFKWERKLIERIDRYLPQLVWIFITLIALFIRRGGLWHVSFDFGSQFYTDDPGYLHTPFYTMFIWLVSHIPVTPIRTVKMIISLFDFGVAAAAVVLIRDRLGSRRDEPERWNKPESESNIRKLLTCYALLLISPVVIENGLTWIHADSICFFAVLCAMIAHGRKKNVVGWILLGAAAALQMQYGVIMIGMAVYCLVKRKGGLKWIWVGIAVTAWLNIIAAIWADLSIWQCLYQLVNWLTVNPATGEMFGSSLLWVSVMLAYYGYLISSCALIAAFCYEEQHRRIRAAAIIQVLLTIYLGWILQYGYFG